jgi:hypothetical protein
MVCLLPTPPSLMFFAPMLATETVFAALVFANALPTSWM